MIPYGRQSISEQDISAVVDVLTSDFLTQGPVVPKFEAAVCGYTKSKYGVAVNSGTSALHVACLALDLGKDDWLWTAPVSFVASANCGLYCGAQVDFVDIDPVTWNISVDRLSEKLVRAKAEKRLPKVLVVVHLCGLPCDMEEIHQLSLEYGFKIIEDGCHAIGGRYKDSLIGSCKFSDITVFSFHPVKTITTGEGGMATTNSEQLAEKMRLLRSHGITRDADEMTHELDGNWYYQQIALGFNYRMCDIQAALGLSQLKRVDEFVARRHEIAKKYNESLMYDNIQLPFHSEEKYSGLHLYVIRIKNERSKAYKKKVFNYLRDNGIGVNVHYIPIHTQPVYKEFGFKYGDFVESECYYEEAISLPIYPNLTQDMQNEVISTLLPIINNEL